LAVPIDYQTASMNDEKRSQRNLKGHMRLSRSRAVVR